MQRENLKLNLIFLSFLSGKMQSNKVGFIFQFRSSLKSGCILYASLQLTGKFPQFITC